MTIWPHRMTRARTFVLIDAAEEDLRSILSRWVVPEIGIEATLGPYIGAARDAAGADLTDPDDLNLIHYLYLQEAVSLLNIHRSLLSEQVAKAARDLTPRLESLSPIRNRVMHGRPLRPEDPDQVVRVANEIVASALDSANLGDVLSRLSDDTNWEPPFVSDRRRDHVLHNLPMPDYDETGLVGRTRESGKLVKHLLGRREPVVTVVGEGGIGKTALAVEALYDLIDHPECPYEAVLWISLKTEALTVSGIVELSTAARSLKGITDQIGAAISADFSGTLEDLADVIDTTDTLIAIDNLETADPADILELYDALPSSVTFLFTSRIGLGELERRLPLGPLTPSDSERLFRSMARQYALDDIGTLPSTDVQGVVGALRYNPLAIKWYIQAVEAGQQPTLALADQDELLQFCVDSVYRLLSVQAKTLLTDLYCLERPVSFAELQVLSELDLDTARETLHELRRSSLLDTSVSPGTDISQSYSVSASARQYIARLLPPPADRAALIKEREHQFRSRYEARRREAVSEALAPHLVHARESSDAPVVEILSEALDLAHRGDESWRDRISVAEKLAPTYFEVPRVLAFIESNLGHIDVASAQYQRAHDMAEPESKPYVAYFFAGHLSRAALRPDLALPFALEAYQSIEEDRAALQYASTLVYLERFSEADPILRQVRDTAAGKPRLIAVTQLVGSLRRQSEWVRSHEHNTLRAFELAFEAVAMGIEELSTGVNDRRLNDATLHSVSESLLNARDIKDLTSIETEIMDLYALIRLNHRTWSRSDRWAYCEANLSFVRERDDLPPSLATFLNASDDEVMTAVGRSRTGELVRFIVDGRFGFIRPQGLGLVEIFFSARRLIDESDEMFLIPGTAVQFHMIRGKQGPQASRISLMPGERDRILGVERKGTITSVTPSHAFVADALTGTSLSLGRGGLVKGTYWSALSPGTDVRYLVDVSERGGRVKNRSASIDSD